MEDGRLGEKGAAGARLIEAAIRGDEAEVRRLLAAGASAKEFDESGYTALMWAARYDLAPMVQLLLPHSDVGARAAGGGPTALEVAKRGAGPKTLSAAFIEAYELALAELAAMRAESGWAPKRVGGQFRI